MYVDIGMYYKYFCLVSRSGVTTAVNIRHVQTERRYQAFPLLGLQRHPLLLDLLLPPLTLVEHGEVVS